MRGVEVNLLMVVFLTDRDNIVEVIERLCDALTNARTLRTDEKLTFRTVEYTLFIYKEKCPYKLEPRG